MAKLVWNLKDRSLNKSTWGIWTTLYFACDQVFSKKAIQEWRSKTTCKFQRDVTVKCGIPVILQRFPVQPGKHSHSKSSIKSWQVAWFSHGFGWQSSAIGTQEHVTFATFSKQTPTRVVIDIISWDRSMISLKDNSCASCQF